MSCAPKRRDELQKFLKEKNIETGIHYPEAEPSATGGHRPVPVHSETAADTEQAVKEILSLPIHGEMSLDAADKVCDAIAEFYGKK